MDKSPLRKLNFTSSLSKYKPIRRTNSACLATCNLPQWEMIPSVLLISWFWDVTKWSQQEFRKIFFYVLLQTTNMFAMLIWTSFSPFTQLLQFVFSLFYFALFGLNYLNISDIAVFSHGYLFMYPCAIDYWL